jgi:hypothetical protein
MAQLADTWSPDERTRFGQDLKKLAASETRFLKETGVWNDMTAAERVFMQTPAPPMQAIIEATWLMESAVCLLWALGRVVELPPYDRQADPELL